MLSQEDIAYIEERGMDAAQILLVEFIKCFAAGDSRLLNQTDCVRFCSHIITVPYYTTKRSRFQV